MNDPAEIIILIRFMKLDHVADFLSGKIRFGLAKYYREKYENEPTGRYDKHELLVETRSVRHIEIEGMPPFENFQGRIYVHATYDSEIYLLCMTAISLKDFDENGILSLNSKMNEFGDVAVLISDVGEFIKRLGAIVYPDDKYGWHPDAVGKPCGLVEYVDFEKFEGAVSPFQKHLDYSYQKEWRFLLMPESVTGDGHYVNIGDISDICQVIDIQGRQRGLKLKISEQSAK